MSNSPSIRTRSHTRQSGTPPVTEADLPSPRPRHGGTKPVSPPLSSTRLPKLIYILILLTSLLGLYYSYRIAQWKTEVGGWWNLALGERPPQVNPSDGMGSKRSWRGKVEHSNRGETVEDRINALASALGMPSRELASAIAIAVREYVPPASLSSITAKETGNVVEALIKGTQDADAQKVEERSKGNAGSEDALGTGVVEGIVNGMGSFVGMDEPM